MGLKSIFLIVFLVLLFGCSPSSPSVCIDETCFDVEVVSTPETRANGLMFRDNLDENKGMLFIFENEEVHYFWMKNTFIPLDIIWMNEAKEIIFISKETPPCKTEACLSYGPEGGSLYVLEINGGLSDKLGLNVGDKVEFKAISTPS